MTPARRQAAVPIARLPVLRAWPPVLGTALVWAALALSVGYWGLRWWGEAPAQTLPPPPLAALNIDSGRVAAALGARGAMAAPAASAPTAGLGSRLQLLGVVAERGGAGAALISVDGQPARPYRVGAVLLDGVRLLSLGPRHAQVGGDTGQTRLALPERSVPSVPAAAAVGVPAVKSSGFTRP